MRGRGVDVCGAHFFMQPLRSADRVISSLSESTAAAKGTSILLERALKEERRSPGKCVKNHCVKSERHPALRQGVFLSASAPDARRFSIRCTSLL